MKKILIVLIAVIALSGCTSMKNIWDKTGNEIKKIVGKKLTESGEKGATVTKEEVVK